MKNRKAMLRPEVKIEPLVNSWHAWPHLLSPPQWALNLAFRYLPAVRSFLAAPSVHVAAASNPKLFGGPFVTLGVEFSDRLRCYLQDIEARHGTALGFAADVRMFSAKLREASGFSLDDYRRDIPDTMRGLVDIAYDLNDRAKLRMLEEIFTLEDLGLAESQSLLLHSTPDLERPFFLGSPRFAREDELEVRTPFASRASHLLQRSRHEPIDLGELSECSGQSRESLNPFFIDRYDRKSSAPYAGDQVRIRYFGHACLLVEAKGLSILFDPAFAQDQVADLSHFSAADLPPIIDYVFLSHAHQDHAWPEMLLHIRDRVKHVVIPQNARGELADPALSRILRQLGFDSIISLNPLDRLEVPGGHITALPFLGEHCDLDIQSKHCATLDIYGRRICMFIDSDAVDIDVYRHFLLDVQDADAVFVGMECFGAPLSWLYGPLTSGVTSRRNDNSRRLSGADCNHAWRLFEMVRPKSAYIYAMGQEPWMRHLMGLNYSPDSVQLLESDRLIQLCAEAGIPAERLYGMKEIIL